MRNPPSAASAPYHPRQNNHTYSPIIDQCSHANYTAAVPLLTIADIAYSISN
ncbi:hypothetical protein DSO57_1012492 [Entomophthora muscae]|uniref:Uncharacterized protein n=1 Tax=Entomophthora muscae TaxID=34485 RepID=A0ACC2SJ64_9FUNG|nr:hypothetical protein DSO57_1012492 [Entomophthora muscae]